MAAGAAAGSQAAARDGDTLATRIEEAFLDTFWGAVAVPRVLESFHRMNAGRDFVHQWPGMGLQHAGSYMEGLTPCPFPDLHNGQYEWLEAVEAAADDIWEEFQAVTADAEALATKGENIWVPAVRDDAVAYGPDWRTLVLQDRGIWHPVNSRLFPCTFKILRDLDAPALEVFFARQVAGTGIKSHTDFVNFIQTSHLGLDIPEGDCWIKVGDHMRKWENGKVIICDTSFFHETQNNTDKDRVVLIMRHFHPEVTPLERKALQFLFDCLDDPSPKGVKAAQKKADALKAGAKQGSKKRKKKAVSGGFGGFGAKN